MLHAVVALGAVHEFMETQGFLNPGKAVENAEDYAERHFALQQSTKAIECLNTQLSTGTPRSGEIVLMSCILFTFVEAIGHNQRAAITHLEAGLKIIGAWLREGDNSDLDGTQRASRRFMIEHIVPMFVRLDVVIIIYHLQTSLQ